MGIAAKGRLFATVCVAAAFAASCGPPPEPQPPVAVEVAPSPRRTLDALRARAQSIPEFRAGLDLEWHPAGAEEAEGCRGSLTWASEERLRLRGHTAAFFTVFDLVAADGLVWLDVPREKTMVHGRRDDPGWARLPLSPEHLRVAVLADPCPPEGCPDPTAGEGPPGLFRIHGPDWVLDVDPATDLPRSYRAGPVEITWDDWSTRRGVTWPRRIEIRTGEDSGILRISLGRLEVGRPFGASTFRMDVEDDRDLLTPSEIADRLGGS